MPDRHQLLESVPFPELTSLSISDDFNPLFDIDKTLSPDLDSYCQQLLYKVFGLKHSEISDFIAHHCSLSKDGMKWLNKFEKLLTVNAELFQGKSAELRLFKFANCIEDKRLEYKTHLDSFRLMSLNQRQINAISEERYFSFFETKKNIEKMHSDDAKTLFLTAEILEFQEADIIMRNDKLISYDLSCKQLIKKIRTLSKLQNALKPESTEDNAQQYPNGVIRLYGPLNIVTNAFKQMMFEVKPNGYPYLQEKIADIATLIYENFGDENGNRYSFDTIRTYLSPTRDDKNPNRDNQVKL